MPDIMPVKNEQINRASPTPVPQDLLMSKLPLIVPSPLREKARMRGYKEEERITVSY